MLSDFILKCNIRDLKINLYMKHIIFVVVVAMLTTCSLSAQSKLAQNLKKGKVQTLVVYGTSISSMAPNGVLWVEEVGNQLNRMFDNKLTVYNSGKSGQNSEWALANLSDSVLSRRPDAVIIEFATNDAVQRFGISIEQCRANTEKLILQIKEAFPECEVFLHTPCGYPLGKNAESRPTMQAYNKIYEELATLFNLIWIDESLELKRIAEEQGVPALKKYAGDGVHPTRKAALELIAPNVVSAIVKGK